MCGMMLNSLLFCVCVWLQDYSGMPTALREAVAFGSFEVTTFVTQHCKKASEKVSFSRIWLSCVC